MAIENGLMRTALDRKMILRLFKTEKVNIWPWNNLDYLSYGQVKY